MSAFEQKTRSLGIRAGILAGASAAVLAIAGLSAGSAMAATPTCPEAKTIAAEGSSLQKIAQEGWKSSYNTTCSGKPASVGYTSTSSLAALEGWGAFNGTTQPHSFEFIGSDEPPEASEITNINKAAKGSTSTTPHVQVVPVAQAAIAIIVNTPGAAGTCELNKIDSKQLEEIYAGTLTEWSKVNNTTGTCTGTIKHVVREDASGTTFQFKYYLGKVNSGAKACPSQTWEKFRTPATPAVNKSWPGGTGEQQAGCPAPATLSGASGGGAIVSKVAATDGSFGYVDLATAENGGAKVLEVQSGTSTYASPLVSGGAHEANCLNTVYSVPTGALTGESSDVSWVNAGGPSTSTGAKYPICTLTYDVAFHDYSEANFGAQFGEVVKDYLLRQVVESGQAQLESDYYAPLPTGTNSVFAAAKHTAEKISN
jgi:phosphate transport system substrate-binding protein